MPPRPGPNSDPRRAFYIIRVAILLGALAIALITLYAVRRDERRPVDWSAPHHVLVCPLVDADADLDATAQLLEASADNLEAWVSTEYARITGGSGTIMRFEIATPVVIDEQVPPRPPDDAGFWRRWQETRRFLGFFTSRNESFPAPWPFGSHIYLHVHPHAETWEFDDQLSAGTRRNRIGIVFAADDPEDWGNVLAVILHETLHTVGALDHREADGTIAYPDGYAEPERSPRFPQDAAEIMALGIPTSSTSELLVSSPDEVVLGPATAREVGWIP